MDSEEVDSKKALREAVVLFRSSKFQEASELLEKALKVDPDDAEAWSLHSQALASMKDYKGAADSVDRSLSLNGDNALNWQLKGTYLLRLGHIYDAIKAIDVSLRIQPTALTYVLRGQAEYNQGKLDKAEMYFQLALTDDAENPLANQMMGLTLFGKKKFADAVPYLDKALSYVKSEHLEMVLDESRRKAEEIMG